MSATHYPRIIEEGKKLGWEWMGHGTTNSVLINRQTEAEERALVREVVETIHKSTGKRPRGWLSPALSETLRHARSPGEAGIQYVGNWVNDDQPYPMRVKTGSMISMPYSAEINDIPALLGLHQSPETFGQMIRDQFDVLYEDGAEDRPGDVDLSASVPDRPSAPQQVFRQGADTRDVRQAGLARHAAARSSIGTSGLIAAQFAVAARARALHSPRITQRRRP